MPPLTPQRLLSVWEQGVRRHPIDRALLLFALAAPETPAEQLADVSLSRRNAALMALHRACFGPRLAAWVDCAACSERMELEVDPARLPPPPEGDPEPIEVAGHRFHRPTSRHLARLTGSVDSEAAARRLLRECAALPADLPRDEQSLAALLDAVDAAMDTADPWADLSLAIRCPACHHEGTAALDLAGILWEEIDARAQRLLDDVHVLARAYGWHETEVLALSETRRAAYLARVQA